VIEVPRADRHDKPVYIGTDMFSGSYKRNHEGDYHCTKEEVKAMLRDQTDTSCDSLVLDDVGLDVLNADSIKSYRIKFKNAHNNHVWNDYPTEDFLIKIGAAKISNVDRKVHPTLAGLIFFGDFMSITDELPNFFLDYREKMSNDTRWSDRVCSGDADWSGNVYDFYFRVIDKLTSDIKRPFKLDENLTRVDDTPLHKAVRECLANALIHADYYGRRGVVIDKEFRKITISNPGTFRLDLNAAI
jgi:ATP-dependent DNA helicase RecG